MVFRRIWDAICIKKKLSVAVFQSFGPVFEQVDFRTTGSPRDCWRKGGWTWTGQHLRVVIGLSMKPYDSFIQVTIEDREWPRRNIAHQLHLTDMVSAFSAGREKSLKQQDCSDLNAMKETIKAHAYLLHKYASELLQVDSVDELQKIVVQLQNEHTRHLHS